MRSMSPPVPIANFVLVEIGAAIEEAIYQVKTPEQALNDLQRKSKRNMRNSRDGTT